MLRRIDREGGRDEVEKDDDDWSFLGSDNDRQFPDRSAIAVPDGKGHTILGVERR